jgi:hypothetical protein
VPELLEYPFEVEDLGISKDPVRPSIVRVLGDDTHVFHALAGSPPNGALLVAQQPHQSADCETMEIQALSALGETALIPVLTNPMGAGLSISDVEPRFPSMCPTTLSTQAWKN